MILYITKILYFVLVALVMFAFPIVFFSLYMNALEKRAKKIIKAYYNDSSKLYRDLKVWVKNFNTLKKKNKFDLAPYETLYSYKKCDLILNDKHIVVIGKVKILGKNRLLNPTIFEFEQNEPYAKPRHVKIENIKEVGGDFEIEFTDRHYSNKMTLVIKRADSELKKGIKMGYNEVHKQKQ